MVTIKKPVVSSTTSIAGKSKLAERVHGSVGKKHSLTKVQIETVISENWICQSWVPEEPCRYRGDDGPAHLQRP